MAKQEGIRIEGVIVDVLPNATFRIEINKENNTTILGYISGKMRQNEIRILEGDNVEVELSPYDLSKGRIVKRL